jgi:hypothetical protein
MKISPDLVKSRKYTNHAQIRLSRLFYFLPTLYGSEYLRFEKLDFSGVFSNVFFRLHGSAAKRRRNSSEVLYRLRRAGFSPVSK